MDPLTGHVRGMSRSKHGIAGPVTSSSLRLANGDLTSSVPGLHCAQECVVRQRGRSRREGHRGRSAEREGGGNAQKPETGKIMAYRAPVEDIIFSLKHAAGLAKARAEGLYQDLGDDDLDIVLGEAGRFASEVLAPLNAAGDRYGTPFRDGEVTMPPGWKEAYRDWAAAGWNGVAAPTAWGGQGLPRAVNAACIEMWNSAAMAFGLGPALTMAAREDALLGGLQRSKVAGAAQRGLHVTADGGSAEP
jgi:hypothetical protein